MKKRFIKQKTIYTLQNVFQNNMKTKSIRNIFVITFILFTIVGCSKFEDGPKISCRSMINRICGTYRIDYFAKNGNDLTDYWNQYYNLTFQFSIPEPSGIENTLFMQIDGDIDSFGIWQNYYISNYAYFDKNDDVTILLYNCIIDTTIFPSERLLYPLVTTYEDSGPIKFTITRLTNREMWLFYEDDSDNYKIHYIEI